MTGQLPTRIRRVVAFDTNAYRALASVAQPEEARRRARALVQAERKRGIQALAYPTVLGELIAHLGSADDPSYRTAKAALVAAVEHASVTVGDQNHHAIWVSPDIQLCKSLWGLTPKELLDSDDLLRGIAARVAHDPSEPALDQIRQDLATVARKFAAAEARFAVSMQEHLIDRIEADARARGWTASRKELLRAYVANLSTERAREAVAMAHVLRAMSYAKVNESPSGLREKAKWVADKFPVAIALYTDLVRKIAQSGWDPATGKGPNSLWDLQVAFLLGPEHSIQRRPVTVVTADRDIYCAAVASGVGTVVMDYQQYRRSLRPRSPMPDGA